MTRRRGGLWICAWALACGTDPVLPTGSGTASAPASAVPAGGPPAPLQPALGGAPDRPPACPTDAVELVRAAYAPYLAHASTPPLAQAACWTSPLRDRILTEQAKAAQNGVPLLGFDPIIDAQDADLDALLLERRSASEVVARFTNFGQDQSVVWTLTHDAAQPRVADLHTDRWRLTDRLSGRP